jgi:hypothetical protein
MLGRRTMLLPAGYAWVEPVLIASIVVFIIDLIGNSIAFGNRFLNALVSAILFAVVFGALVYFSNDDAKSNRPRANKKVSQQPRLAW